MGRVKDKPDNLYSPICGTIITSSMLNATLGEICKSLVEFAEIDGVPPSSFSFVLCTNGHTNMFSIYGPPKRCKP